MLIRLRVVDPAIRKVALALLGVIGCLTLLVCAGQASAQGACRAGLSPPGAEDVALNPASQVTPVVWSLLHGPVVPVAGSDGRTHLAYTLRFLNLAASTVNVGQTSVVDPRAGDAVTGTSRQLDDSGNAITGALFGLPASPDFVHSLTAGQSGLMFFDVTYSSGATLPATIAHRVTQSVAGSPAGEPITAVSAVARICPNDAITVRPPLRGDGWVVGLGCCLDLSAHRSAILPINGALRPAQAFAIDFLKLDEQGRGWVGDQSVLTNWFDYGQPIYAAVAGRVVSSLDGLPNQKPGGLPVDLPVSQALGNNVIVDIGNGRYAFYAHMMPGSVRVHPGDRVAVGTMLGQLGNTGNTSAPHLHFQIMDRPSALDADGLPFQFDAWTLQYHAAGTLAQLDDAIAGGNPVERGAPFQQYQVGTIPLNNDVASFR